MLVLHRIWILTLVCIRGVQFNPTFCFSHLLLKRVKIFPFFLWKCDSLYRLHIFLVIKKNYHISKILFQKFTNVYIHVLLWAKFYWKILLGKWFSNFGHITIFLKQKFYFWPPFCNKTFCGPPAMLERPLSFSLSCCLYGWTDGFIWRSLVNQKGNCRWKALTGLHQTRYAGSTRHKC